MGEGSVRGEMCLRHASRLHRRWDVVGNEICVLNRTRVCVCVWTRHTPREPERIERARARM